MRALMGLRGAAALLAASLLVATGTAPSAGGPPAQLPNVLIILTDDQRASGTMGVMPKTRHLFGDRGTRFTHAYATTPICCPSRASIFTGQYAHNHEVRNNSDAQSLDQEATIQRRLQDEGYRTALLGKFLNDWPLGDAPPHFDRWVMGTGYYGTRFNIDGRVRRVDRYATDFLGDRAARLIGGFSRNPAPWFVYVAPYAPHIPATPEPAYEDAPVGPWGDNPAVRERDRTDKPPFVRDQHADLQKARRYRALQLRSLRSVDDMVDVILDAVRRAGERRDTLAFFLSDNGYLWREHGILRKAVAYTESVQIPMFARWPGRIPGGAKDERLVANVDLAPTILDAAGLPIPPDVDGRSLLQGFERDRILAEAWAGFRRPPWAMLRGETYHYVEYYEPDGVTVSFREYYDLTTDHWLLENLLGDGDAGNDPPPDLLAELSVRLARDRDCSGSVGTGACP